MSDTTVSLDQALQLALQHHRAGQFPQAEHIYKQIIAAAPNFPDAWQLLGTLALQVGQAEASLPLFAKALELLPANAPVCADISANRGEALRSLKRLPEAEAALRAALTVNPGHLAACNNLGNTLRDLGRLADAARCFEAVLQAQPEHVRALNNLALTYVDLQRPADARATFARALQLAPDNADIRHNHAELARDAGDFATALADYATALRLNPEHTSAYYGYFVTRMEQLTLTPPAERPAPPAATCPPCDQPEFSVIVCSHRPQRLAEVTASLARGLAGEAWELIAITDATSLAEGYQRGLANSRGGIVLFSHDDIEVLSPDLGGGLRRALAEFDLVGIAGTDRLIGAHWQEGGWPHLHGLVLRPLPDDEGGGADVCLFGSSAPLIGGLHAVDGCFFAARREVFQRVTFDADTFDGFHLYDIDFSYAAHLAGLRVGVSTELLVAHASPGNYDAQWQVYADRFNRKYAGQLPVAAARPAHFLMATLPNLAAAHAFARDMVALHIPNTTATPQTDGGYSDWCKRFEREAHDAAALAQAVAVLPARPRLSVLMPVYNPRPEWLAEAIDSVINQAYPDWELCIADDASPDPAVRATLEAYAARDPRIRVHFRDNNGHICASSNDALALASGDWLVLLDHDDLLPPHALYWIARTVADHPAARIIYSDEDKIDEHGQRRDPYFKPDWNPELLWGQNFVSHLGAYHRQTVVDLGGFRAGYEGSQDYDLALRVAEHCRPEQIRHIPRVLYHWRVHAESTAGGNEAKPYAQTAAVRALDSHRQRLGIAGTVSATPFGYRLQREVPTPAPRVSIIVPTRDGRLLQPCLDSLLAHTAYPSYELLLIDNGSESPATRAYLEQLAAQSTADRPIRIRRDERPFNFSALNNTAAAEASGELLLFLNDDIEIPATQGDWLHELVSHAVRPEVGAVGARLLFADGTLQHGGVILVGGVAGHAHKHIPGAAPGYFGRARLQQNFSAVTAACLLVKKCDFTAVGGFAEELAVCFNDVDFCLKLQARGLWNVWTPYAELIHHESVSRGRERTPEQRLRFTAEANWMKARWGQLLRQDPAYSPNLTFTREDFSLAWPPRLPEFAKRGEAKA